MDHSLSLAAPAQALPALDARRGDYPYAEFDWVEDGRAGIDLRALLAALYRNRWLIAVVLAITLAAGVASILLTPPTYRARASVQVDQQLANVLGTQEVEPAPSAQEAERFLQTQVDVIESRAMAASVAERLNLLGDAALAKAVTGAVPVAGVDPVIAREQAIDAIQDRLTVTLPRNSRVIGIGFDSRDPAAAARVANSFTEAFIEGNLQRRFNTTSHSREFLQKQLAATKSRLEASERALISYARGAQLIDASAGASPSGVEAGPRSLTTSNLVQINQAYSQARSGRIQAEQRWRQAQATPVMSLPEVLGNPAVQQLTQRRAELEAKFQEERQRRKVEHPAVEQAAANIAELDRQIGTLAASIRASIRDQYMVAARQERSLAGNVGQLKGETLAEQDRGVRYNILKREVDTNRELYDGLLQRFKEVSAQAGATNNNISVVDAATPPLAPVSPNPVLNMALAVLSGLAFALALVFGREKLDDAIRAPEDVENKLHLPLLGVVPLLKGGGLAAEAAMEPRSPLSEAHQALRTSIELSSSAGGPSTLLLTSSRQAEGKSTTALGLASGFAAAGQRVLLIDADLRRPSLHRLLGLPNKRGLSNLLARHKTLAEVVQQDEVRRLDFISSGPLPPSPAELLASHTLHEVIATVREQYDLVVIDGPPVLGLADGPRLAAASDATVFVVEANGAHRGHTKGALKRLSGARVKVVGAVLTKYDARKAGYAYGDAYSYAYGLATEAKPALPAGAAAA